MAGRRIAGVSLAIVIPALDEADTIGEVVAGAAEHGHVVVIDNGSTDGTADIARKAGADVVRLDQPGYDAALNAGFAHAQAQGFDRVLTMDADGQHDPADIPSMVEQLDSGAAVVYGIRPRGMRMSERLCALASGALCGVVDPFCGMKGYQIEVYRNHGQFDSCRSIGSELLFHAARAGLPVRGVRINLQGRRDRPRFGRGIVANLQIISAFIRVINKTGRASRK